MMTQTKQCRVCLEEKPVTEFYFGVGRNRKQYTWACKACIFVKKNARWRKKHPEIRRREDLTADKKCPKCEVVKAYTEFSKAACRSGGIDPYCKDCKREMNLERSRKEPREIKNARRHKLEKKKNLENPIYYRMREAIRRAKVRAKEYGVPYDLDIDYVMTIVPTHCPALGIPLDFTGKGGTPNPSAPSIDRFIPALGYTKGNVNIISWKANRIKLDATAEELMSIAQWAQRLAKMYEMLERVA